MSPLPTHGTARKAPLPFLQNGGKGAAGTLGDTQQEVGIGMPGVGSVFSATRAVKRGLLGTGSWGNIKSLVPIEKLLKPKPGARGNDK